MANAATIPAVEVVPPGDDRAVLLQSSKGVVCREDLYDTGAELIANAAAVPASG